MEKRHLEKELDSLRLKVLEMAALAEKALTRALTSVYKRNADLAEEVIESDCDVNELQYAIDEKCLRMLALDQPVARDLRFIIGSSYIASNLERIADEAVNIAERSILLAQRAPLAHNPLVEDLAQAVQQMFSTVVTAFSENDADTAYRVCEMDAKADALNLRILKHYIDSMIQESRTIERAVHLIIMSRSLERVGDLSTNIAENIIFIIKGVDIRQSCHPY